MAKSEYAGRTFLESDYYPPKNRAVVNLTGNKVWLTTVDEVFETDDEGNRIDETLIRVRKWRARNLGNNGEENKVWQEVGAFNVRHSDIWDNIAGKVAKHLRYDEFDRKVAITEEEHERLLGKEEEVQNLRESIRELKDLKQTYAGEVEMYKKRLQLMKGNIAKYEGQLEEFQKLINDGSTTETDVHKFLEQNEMQWIFGLDYLKIDSEVAFPPGSSNYRFDLMLERHDNFWDLIELKGPNENLFDQRTKRRTRPNQKLSEALGQVFTYLRACEIENLDEIFKPKAYIVIGTEETDDVEERRLFSSYLSNIEAITYSELYRRGEKLVDHLSGTELED